MSTLVEETPTQNLEPFQGVKKVPYEEYYTSGHRTCQGCESAEVMKLMAKAAGPRTIVLGSTGCMYVANTSYYATPWGVPWMHTQLGSSGSSALGAAAAFRVQMRKGVMKEEPINVIAFCGDGGGADMGLGAISATLTHPDYNLLILMYDNESYANTDIQISGTSPVYSADTFVAHQEGQAHHESALEEEHGADDDGWPSRLQVCRNHLDLLPAAGDEQRSQGAVSIRRPDVHSFARSLPKGWDYDPVQSFELGELAVNTGIWPLYEIENGKLKLYGKTKDIANGRFKRLPVRDYLLKQGRFAHFVEEDIEFFQSKIDEMWNKWLVPGVIPLQKEVEG